MLYQEEIRLIKKILSDIVSKQNINSKQNIKVALTVKDKKYLPVKSSCLKNNPKTPKCRKWINKQNKISCFSNINSFR